MTSMTPPDSKARKGGYSGIIRNLDTIAAYDLWSEVYDTDGNFLQALDTIEMRTLLDQTLSQITTSPPWKIVDLGCGTGRNTSHLLEVENAIIIGLDASPKMLKVAKSKLFGRTNAPSRPCEGSTNVTLYLYDMLADPQPPACALNADAVISTLVLEHVPLDVFFEALHQILKPGGIALVTNMHSEMGKISQAGFVDPSTGQKVRPRSYAHRLEDLRVEAKARHFEVIGDVIERRVDEEMAKELGARAKKWIGVIVWFGLRLRKRD